MKGPGPPWQLFAVGFLGFIAVGIPNAALGVAWVQMQRSFQVSLEALGLVTGALLAGRIVTSIYSGRLASQLGTGNYMLAGSLLMLAGLAGIALAPGLIALALLHALLSVGVSALNAGINIHAAAHYSGSRMNMLHTGFGIGSALGPLIVTLVVFRLELDWRIGYLVFVALQLGLILLLLRTRHAWRAGDSPSIKSGEVQPLRSSLRLAPAWFGIALFFLHGGLQLGTGALGNSLMIDGRGIAPDLAGLWIGIFWAGLTLGRVLTSLMVPRFGNDRFMRVNMLLTMVGTLMLWFGPTDHLIFAGIALIGFTLAPVLPLLLADTPGRVGAAHSPNVIGLQIGFSGIGIAVLPGLMAVLADRVGLETIGASLFLIALLSFLAHEGLLACGKRPPAQATLSPVR